MKIATWNVNSLNVRLPHVLDWLATHRPEVLCLQELKLEDKDFPVMEIQAAGYHAVFAGQKTYNGVAILARTPPETVLYGIPGFADEQKRLIAATVAGVRVVCGYFPNGQSLDSDKFTYKLAWIEALTTWLKKDELPVYPRFVLAGDFNIAPEPQDAHPSWKGSILVSPAERAAFRALIDIGLIDSFRLFDQPEPSYSHWDYRMNAFRRNVGLRIDHLLVSPTLQGACRACQVDVEPRKLERPSDHAPVMLDFDD